MGLEPGAAGWKAQTNPLSYDGTPGGFSVKCFHSRDIGMQTLRLPIVGQTFIHCATNWLFDRKIFNGHPNDCYTN